MIEIAMMIMAPSRQVGMAVFEPWTNEKELAHSTNDNHYLSKSADKTGRQTKDDDHKPPEYGGSDRFVERIGEMTRALSVLATAVNFWTGPTHLTYSTRLIIKRFFF